MAFECSWVPVLEKQLSGWGDDMVLDMAWYWTTMHLRTQELGENLQSTKTIQFSGDVKLAG
jgi:hypothetical protein